MFTLLAQTSTFFGTIEPPPALEPYGENGGLIMFGSNALKFAVIIGGLIALFNVVMAGYIYLTSAGDTKANEKVMGKLTSSLWGISLMILAPAVMAIMGFLLFKNSTYFLNPQLVGPGSASTTSGGGNGKPGSALVY